MAAIARDADKKAIKDFRMIDSGLGRCESDCSGAGFGTQAAESPSRPWKRCDIGAALSRLPDFPVKCEARKRAWWNWQTREI